MLYFFIKESTERKQYLNGLMQSLSNMKLILARDQFITDRLAYQEIASFKPT